MAENEPRMREVERKLDLLIQSVDGLGKRFDGQDEEQRNFRAVIHGDGNGKRGILVRIDRLEQTSVRMSKLMWLLCGTAATAAGFQILG